MSSQPPKETPKLDLAEGPSRIWIYSEAQTVGYGVSLQPIPHGVEYHLACIPSSGGADLTEAEMAEALRIYWLGPNVFSENLRAAINSVLRGRAALSSSPSPAPQVSSPMGATPAKQTESDKGEEA